MLSCTIRPVPASADVRYISRGVRPVGGRRVSATPSFSGNGEPSLDEVMGDPMVLRLMARDGVAVAALRSLIAEVRGRLLA